MHFMLSYPQKPLTTNAERAGNRWKRAESVKEWRDAFRILADLGFAVVTVAGEGPVDRLVPSLAIGAPAPPGGRGPEHNDALDDEIATALADADLVVVENLCTLPLNLPAALSVGRVLTGRRAVFHHHDPPWQRAEWAHVDALPLRGDDGAGDAGVGGSWRHVTINALTAAEFADRGIPATCIYNGFPLPPPPDPRRRAELRSHLDVSDTEVLVAHPVRAIPRKRIDRALALCGELGATYWLWGPAEFGFGAELDRLVADARCRVLRTPPPDADAGYDACDLVVFPSDWEGFGNPPVEAALRGLPAAVGPYPVGRELAALGFSWLDAADPGAVAAALGSPDTDTLDRNRGLAEHWFGIDRVADDLTALLGGAGWLP